jgi:hypothetical protein
VRFGIPFASLFDRLLGFIPSGIGVRICATSPVSSVVESDCHPRSNMVWFPIPATSNHSDTTELPGFSILATHSIPKLPADLSGRLRNRGVVGWSVRPTEAYGLMQLPCLRPCIWRERGASGGRRVPEIILDGRQRFRGVFPQLQSWDDRRGAATVWGPSWHRM